MIFSDKSLEYCKAVFSLYYTLYGNVKFSILLKLKFTLNGAAVA